MASEPGNKVEKPWRDVFDTMLDLNNPSPTQLGVASSAVKTLGDEIFNVIIQPEEAKEAAENYTREGNPVPNRRVIEFPGIKGSPMVYGTANGPVTTYIFIINGEPKEETRLVTNGGNTLWTRAWQDVLHAMLNQMSEKKTVVTSSSVEMLEKIKASLRTIKIKPEDFVPGQLNSAVFKTFIFKKETGVSLRAQLVEGNTEIELTIGQTQETITIEGNILEQIPANFQDILQQVKTKVEQKERQFPRIIIADDNVDLAEIVADEFRAKGYLVILVENGEDALIAYKSLTADGYRIRAVITDQNMPNKKGLELAADLINLGFSPEQIVVQTTEEIASLRAKLPRGMPFEQLIYKGTNIDDYYLSLDRVLNGIISKPLPTSSPITKEPISPAQLKEIARTGVLLEPITKSPSGLFVTKKVRTREGIFTLVSIYIEKDNTTLHQFLTPDDQMVLYLGQGDEREQLLLDVVAIMAERGVVQTSAASVLNVALSQMQGNEEGLPLASSPLEMITPTRTKTSLLAMSDMIKIIVEYLWEQEARLTSWPKQELADWLRLINALEKWLSVFQLPENEDTQTRRNFLALAQAQLKQLENPALAVEAALIMQSRKASSPVNLKDALQVVVSDASALAERFKEQTIAGAKRNGTVHGEYPIFAGKNGEEVQYLLRIWPEPSKRIGQEGEQARVTLQPAKESEWFASADVPLSQLNGNPVPIALETIISERNLYPTR